MVNLLTAAKPDCVDSRMQTQPPQDFPEPAGHQSGEASEGPGLVRNLRYLLTSTSVIRIGGFVYSILLRRLLGPRLIGVWNLTEIIVSTMQVLTIGIGYSAERAIPQLRARGNREEEARLRDVLLSWTLIEGVIVALAVAAYALFRPGDAVSSLAWFWAAPLYVLQKIFSVGLMLAKSRKAFASYSKAITVGAALDWTMLLGAWWFGLQGLLAGAVIAALAKVAYLRIAEGGLLAFEWRIDAGTVRAHMPYGLKYGMFKALWTVGERLDSVTVGYLLGTTSLGLYYLGFQLQRVALEVPLALIYVASPNLMERIALSDGGRSFSREFVRYLRVLLFVILPLVLPAAYFGSELLIRLALPAFFAAIVPIKITMAALGLLAVRYLYYQVLAARDRLGGLVAVTALQLPAFAVVFVVVRPYFESALVAVATANFIAYVLHLFSTQLLTRTLVDRQGVSGWRRSTELAACLAMAGLLWVADTWVTLPMRPSVSRDVLNFCARSGAFLVMVAPMSYLGLGPDRHRAREVLSVLARRRPVSAAQTGFRIGGDIA